MKCVEANVDAPEEAQNTICQKEFKDMRLSAYKDQLQYHYINKAKINANAQRTISMILPDKISKKIVDLYSILIVKFK